MYWCVFVVFVGVFVVVVFGCIWGVLDIVFLFRVYWEINVFYYGDILMYVRIFIKVFIG